MSSWWRSVPGLDASALPDQAEMEFIWMNPPGPWMAWLILLVAGLCLAGVWWMYRRETAVCPGWIRRTLAGLRILVLLVLTLIFLGPALGVYQRQVIEPVILVLVDDSASMSVIDPVPASHDSLRPARGDHGADQGIKRSRSRQVADLLKVEPDSWLSRLQSRGRVILRSFSDRLGPAVDGHQALELSAQGLSTDLATAMDQAVRDLGQVSLAAVVLASDGQVTAGDDPRPLARALGAKGIPLLVLGVGQEAADMSWRVTEVWAKPTVWRGDPFTIEVMVAGSGSVDQNLVVELWERPVEQPADDARLIERRTVSVEASQTQRSLTFQHTAAQTGRFFYSARIASESARDPALDEPILEPVQALVEVVEEQARVLLVSGRPGWDFQAVKNLLLRERSVKLSVWLQSLAPDLAQQGTLPLEALPDSPATLFTYDLVVLMDPMLDVGATGHPRAIGPAWLKLLEQLVGEQGGGLMFVPGPLHTAGWIQLPAAEPLRGLLPVTFGKDQSLDLEALVRPPVRPWPMRLTAEAADHPVLRLTTTAGPAHPSGHELATVVYWSFPAQAAKPGARILLEHGDPALGGAEGPRPLLAVGQYGPGRTLYLGIDSTWRWRSLGHDSEYFDRFWLQSLRYLVEGRRLAGARRGSISLLADHFPIGSSLNLAARLLDDHYAPLTQPRVQAQLHSPGQDPLTIDLQAVAGRPGQYQATVPLRHLGVHEIIIDLGTDARGQPVRITRRFQVQVPRIEFADTRLNRHLLMALAQLSGGRYYDLTEAQDLARDVPDRTQVRIVPWTPIRLWDNWLVLGFLIAILAIEWILRRRLRMM